MEESEAFMQLPGTTLQVLTFMRGGARKLVCALALCSFSAPVGAEPQNVAVEGTVTLENGQGAKGAIVLFERINGKGHKETKADKTGHYIARRLPEGTYNVFAAVVGLVDKAEGYNVSRSGNNPLNFTLKSPPPTQPPFVAGCVAAREIRATVGGFYVVNDNGPRLKALVANGCPYLADIWVTLAYYDTSGVQVDTQLEHATVAPGTEWSLDHTMPCARYSLDCTPQQWRARIRIIEVQAYRR